MLFEQPPRQIETPRYLQGLGRLGARTSLVASLEVYLGGLLITRRAEVERLKQSQGMGIVEYNGVRCRSPGNLASRLNFYVFDKFAAFLYIDWSVGVLLSVTTPLVRCAINRSSSLC